MALFSFTRRSLVIAFLLVSALVATSLLVCLSPLRQTLYLSGSWSSFYHTPNYTDAKPNNHDSETFQPFVLPSILLPQSNNSTAIGVVTQDAEINNITAQNKESISENFQPSPSPVPLPKPKREKRDIGLERIEEGLARAKAAIREAIQYKNSSSFKKGTYIPRGIIYRNQYAFHQSHTEMERRFKVWVYKEGELPLSHGAPVNDIYGVEGQFLDEMESNGKNPFIARHPDEAHAFLLPISVAYIIHFVYGTPRSFSRDQIQRLVTDYVEVVSNKYPYWNRSNGADHFSVSCHDWAPSISGRNPKLFRYFIRVLCNANTTEGFRPQRDVSIPEIKIPVGMLGPPAPHGQPPSKRSVFAFFAGGAHGHIRQVLLKKWKDKDDEVQVHGYLDRNQNYFQLIGKSKFCLCPSGYEVASPRVVTAIQLGCVPVTISDNYTLPFSDVLDWSKFSVHIPSAKIPEIKTILKGISYKRYLTMQRRVMQIRRHFMLNRPAQPYDMIHMVLHSVWLRRLNIKMLY